MEDSFRSRVYFQWKYLSWTKSFNNLLRIQSRLFKSFLVGNLNLGFSLQTIILRSNSTFLIAIREITQIDVLRRLPGVDGKIFLDFADRFELAEYLKKNLNNWKPFPTKRILLTRKDGSSFYIKLSVVSDRCWQTVVKYALCPAHEALFSFKNFGFRICNSVFDLQNLVILNLNEESFGSQKRILLFDFSTCSLNLLINRFLKKVLLPRSIKLGVFRFLKTGLLPEFSILSGLLNLSAVLANILFDEVDHLAFSLRYGYKLIFFLKPCCFELFLIKKLQNFLQNFGFDFNYYFDIFNPFIGFNFLDWRFSLASNFDVLCTPSFSSYQIFLKRIKRVVNNSNFGANIKSLKLVPIVRDWNFYNRFTNIEFLKFSLFFLKKRAFKIFNSESKQDKYSTKLLINNCFKFDFEQQNLKNDLNFLSHISFRLPYSKDFHIASDRFFYGCVHCGIKMYVNKF